MKRHHLGFAFGLLALALALGGCGPEEESVRPLRTFADLNDPSVKIGSESAVVAIEMASKVMPRATYCEFRWINDVYAALNARQISAIVYDRPCLEFAAASDPDLVVLSEDIDSVPISVAARMESKALIEKVNEFIRQYRQDGTYAEMYKRWILTKDPVMPKILEADSSAGEIAIAIDTAYVPMSYVADGKRMGFDIEFSLRLAKFLGKRPVFLDLSYDTVIPAVLSGKAALAIAQIQVTPDREKGVLFSESYTDAPTTVLVRREDYEGRRVKRAFSAAAAFRSLARSFYRTFVEENRWRMVLQGLGVTLRITFFATVLGTFFAILLCFLRRSRLRLLRGFAIGFRIVLQSTPELLVLMVLFYAVFAGSDISGVLIAVLGFALVLSSTVSEVFLAGFDALPLGQIEASLAIGFTRVQAFIYVVLPQMLRLVLPVYRSQIVILLKLTSVASCFAVRDLTMTGDLIRSRTYEAFVPLISIAAIYLMASGVITLMFWAVSLMLDPRRRVRQAQRREEVRA